MPLEATDLSSAQFQPALGPSEPTIQLVLGALCSDPKCRWVRSGPCAVISAQVKSKHGAVRLHGRALSWYGTTVIADSCMYIMSHFIADISCGSLSYVVTVNTNWEQKSATLVLK